MNKYNWEPERVKRAVKESSTYSMALRLLDIPCRGNNIKTLRRVIDKYNIDTSHFTGQTYSYGNDNFRYKNVDEYLYVGSTVSSFRLKEKLIKDGLKQNVCELCGITYWRYRPLVLQLHHINGIHNDNRLENLQLLCPNCHSQTDTYAGKRTHTTKHKCKICGKEISYSATYCRSCYDYIKRQCKVSDKQLLMEYKKCKNYSALARKYNVSEAAIRKRIKRLV